MDTSYAIAAASLVGLAAYKLLTYDSSLDAIPTVGWSAPGLSYLSAIRFLFHGRAILQEGYEKHKDGMFKIPMIDHWSVIVNSPKLIEELRRAPDDHLDFNEAVVRSTEAWYTLGPSVVMNDYHTGIIRSVLTRNLSRLFPVIRDEISSAFSEIIPTDDSNDWVKVPVMDAMLKIVCRTSNRIFVGPQKCRDPDWIALNSQFTIDVMTSAMIINRFPEFMKPIAGRIFSKLPSYVRRTERHIGPIIAERQKMMAELGDNWTDKPNDMLMWLMENAQGDELQARNLSVRLLTVNFAAMHTSSMSFTQALYQLAGNPEFIAPLREEVETVVASEGWTKEALGKMRKVDSFLRESQRFNGLGLLVLSRYVHKPFTFSNGITVPAGTVLEVPVSAIHHDDHYYPDGDVFYPWRFSDMRDDEGQGLKHQMVSTTLDDSGPFLTFGHGRHACPGRFFAANELKAMLAHLVTKYDIKLEDGAPYPRNMCVGSVVMPARANVMFRKRQSS